MSAAKHPAIRRQLEALLNRMRPQVSAMTEQALSPSSGHGASELSNVPYHLADGGTDEFLHDINATLLENEEYLVNEVRAALARLDKGAFGRCEQCGKAIATARLEAIPYARYCITCAATANNSPDVNVDRGRPRTPADTLTPEEDLFDPDQSSIDGSFVNSTTDLQQQRQRPRGDVHAAGTPGGGGSSGGLAGTNEGRGDPEIGELEDEMGSSAQDVNEARDAEPDEPRSGRSGGAVGGVPANKRARIK